MERYPKESNLFVLSRSLAERFVTKSAIEIEDDFDKKGYLINMFLLLLQGYHYELAQNEKNAFVKKVKEFNKNISTKEDNEVVDGFFELFKHHISAAKFKDPIFYYITQELDFKGEMLSNVFAELLPGASKGKEWHFFRDFFNELVGFSEGNKIYNSVKERISAVKKQKANKKVQKANNYSNVANNNHSKKYISNDQNNNLYNNHINNVNSKNSQLPQYFISNKNVYGNNISQNSNPNYINIGNSLQSNNNLNNINNMQNVSYYNQGYNNNGYGYMNNILSYNDNQNYIYNGNYVQNTYNNQNIMNNIQNNQHQNQQAHNNNQINNGNSIWSPKLFLDVEHPIDSEYCGK